jgi:hypothetical protein
MVTLAGGLFVSVAVFMLSRNTSALYQRETRIANANLASVIGFERLRADISRAGFMASPHIRRDPFVCGEPGAGWPAQLAQLTSVRITNILPVPAVAAANGLAPQRIVLAGNFSSAEAFPVRGIYPSGDNFDVHLQVETGTMSRLGYNEVGANRQAILESAFPIGRAVRIVDKSGRHHYGTLQAVNTEPLPILTLADGGPDLIFRDESGIGCGLKGEETGAMINTVNFIRYDIRSLDGNARYQPIYDVDGPDYDDARQELVRVELDPLGAEIDDTLELVAEYAIDLRFGLTVAPSQRVSLVYVAPGNTGDYAGDPVGMAQTGGPQMIRTIHTWLSVRSREADREADLGALEGANGPRFRVGLGSSGSAPFARLRTVQARSALPNQMGVTWQ